METENSIFWIKEGEIRQGGALILKSVNLHLERGEFVYLIGKTGSGKSSLLKALYGELPLDAGEGKISEFNLHTLKRKDIPFLLIDDVDYNTTH